MELEHKIVTHIEVHACDLEKLILDKTGKKVWIPHIIQCGNDTVHTFEALKKNQHVDDEEMEEAKKVLSQEPHGDYESYSLEPLLSMMCRHGWIDEGRYLIYVGW